MLSPALPAVLRGPSLLLHNVLPPASSVERKNELRGLDSMPRPSLEVETLGEEGLRYRSKITSSNTRGWRKVDPYKIGTIKDTGGAEDWCTAGIIHILGQNGFKKFQCITATELHKAFSLGQAMAAWSCNFEGARGGMYAVNQERFELEVLNIINGAETLLRPSTNSEFSQEVNTRAGYIELPNQGQEIKDIATTTEEQSARAACCF